MAKRYFNVFRNHIAMLVLLLALICTGEFTRGTVSMVARIATGAVMIYVAIMFAVWLIKSPTASIKEENL